MGADEPLGLRMEGVPAVRVGRDLQRRRTAQRVTRADAAAVAGVSGRELEQIERGAERASPATLAALLALYGCTIDEFLPPRRPLDPELLTGLPDRQILQHYVRLVRQWRGVSAGKEMLFRPEDVRVLVGLLGTDAAEIERLLIALTGCSRSTARRLRRLLVVGLALPLSVLGAAAVMPGLAGPSGGTAVAPSAPVRLVTRPAVKIVPAPAVTLSRAPAPTVPVPTTRAPVKAAPAAVKVAVAPRAPAAGGLVASVADEEATVAIPRLGLDLPVVEGGQSIIDEGVVAHYVGAGWLAPVPAGAPGTYWLAAHHVTHGGPFDALPEVRIGDQVVVTTATHTFVYTITSTQVVGIYAGYGPVYGTDPAARTILLQTCLNETDRFLVHGTLTSAT